jgi:hypothetical protein
VSTRQFASFSVGIGIPLSPLETFTFHLSNEFIEDFNFLETYNRRPKCFTDELEVFGLWGRVKRDFLCDKGINLILL